MHGSIGALGALLTAGLLMPSPATPGDLGLRVNGSTATAWCGMKTSAGCSQLSAVFTEAARQYRLSSKLLRAVCFVESRHNTHAYLPKDGKTPSYGICQVKYSTATSLGFRGSRRELQRPENSIYYAAAYLRYQLDRYKGDEIKAIKAYNIGHARTRVRNAYVTRVLQAMKEGR